MKNRFKSVDDLSSSLNQLYTKPCRLRHEAMQLDNKGLPVIEIFEDGMKFPILTSECPSELRKNIVNCAHGWAAEEDLVHIIYESNRLNLIRSDHAVRLNQVLRKTAVAIGDLDTDVQEAMDELAIAGHDIGIASEIQTSSEESEALRDQAESMRQIQQRILDYLHAAIAFRRKLIANHVKLSPYGAHRSDEYNEEWLEPPSDIAEKN